MKKLIFILVFVMFLPVSAHPFWIWSGKEKKLKNPAIGAKLSPAFCLQDGIKQYDKKRYKKARLIFITLVKKYPDAFEAADAQYYLGLTLEGLKQPYRAYIAYQKVLDSYPNSKHINSIIEHEYNIAESLMNTPAKKILGFTKYDFVEHPSIEIFKKISDTTANVAYASKSQYQLGLLYMRLARYMEAKEAFTKVIDKYPSSEWLAPAKYQLAQATAKGFSGTDYDTTSVTEAAQRLDEFVLNHSESEITPEAQEQLQNLINEEAKKQYDTARFYQRIGKPASAKIYYSLVINNYSNTKYGPLAEKALHDIK